MEIEGKITKDELERAQRLVEWSRKTIPTMYHAQEVFSRLIEKLGSHE